MYTRRVYSSAINKDTGEIILPWISVVMASLLLREVASTIEEVCLDISLGDVDLSKRLRSQVYNCFNTLENFGFVSILSGRKYKPTAKGSKQFSDVLDKVVSNNKGASSLSDSTLLNLR